MAQFKIKSLNPFIIELLEDLKKGEVLNISQSFNDDEITLNNLINEKVLQQYNVQIDNLKKEWDKNYQENLANKLKNRELELNQQYQEKLNDLCNEKELLENKLQSIKKETELSKDNEFNQKLNEKDQVITELTTQNQLIEENIKNQLKIQYEKELNQKNILIDQKQNEIKLNKEKSEKEKQEIEYQLKERYEEELNKKQNEIDELKRSKNLLGTKDLGNELENYCEQQIQTQLIDAVGNDGSISLTRASIVGHESKTKADFVIHFHTPSNIYSVNEDKHEIINELKDDFVIVLEMKSEALETKDENRKTNKDHLKKLVKDASAENAKVAILVTELEKHDKFLIRRINNFEYDTEMEIFLVRPECLVYLLSILRIIYLKYSVIKEREDFDFLQKEDILKKFNEFKNELIDIQIKNINLNLEKIKKSAEDIKKSADEIWKSANTIIDTHINQLKNKINDFKIETKVIKKIEKLEKTKVIK